MQIGDVIRRHRKDRNMTQEQVAERLGVTVPAVNKWERGDSYPDITLLSPIARLFDVSLETLLCHEKTLSDAKAKALVGMLDEKLKTQSLDETFAWVKRCLQEFPSSPMLQLYMARVFYGQLSMLEIEERDVYDAYLIACFERVLGAGDDAQKRGAAESLLCHYMSKEQYDKAESYLAYFTQENPERKRKQAMIYEKTGRREQARKAYEELLYTNVLTIDMTFQNLIVMALEEGELEQAHMLVDKVREYTHVFEFGEFREYSSGLELAILERDENKTLEIVQHMLNKVPSIADFMKSPLFSHMELKELNEDYFDEIKQNLLAGFRNEEQYFYMQKNANWNALVNTE